MLYLFPLYYTIESGLQKNGWLGLVEVINMFKLLQKNNQRTITIQLVKPFSSQGIIPELNNGKNNYLY